MTIKEVKELIQLLDDTNLAEFQFKNKDVEVKIRSNKFYEGKNHSFISAPQLAYQPQAMQSAAPQALGEIKPTEEAKPVATNLIEIKSPMVGTFYRSSSPDKPAFASVGDSIQKGSVVCIIEAMKLFNEIESEITGKIVKVLVEDATPVEYDQVLFLVEP